MACAVRWLIYMQARIAPQRHTARLSEIRSLKRSPASTLQLSPEEMRRLGYRTIDLIIDHLTTLPNRPVTEFSTPERLDALLDDPLPEQGTDYDEVLDHLQGEVLGAMSRTDHPRFFAFVPGPSNFVSAMADTLASGFNVFAGAWTAGAGPAQIERLTIDWLAQLCGLPETAGGLFVNGGSEANLLALRVARKVLLADDIAGAVVYASDQTHVCVTRALEILGFSSGQLRVLPSDDDYRLSMGALREAVAADRARGLRPFCVVANVGTTNTGAVDPLPDLANFCRSEGLWLHADGAYGAGAVLCRQGKEILAGLEAVDSLTLDPHKWLFQPYEIGCVLLRDRECLRDSFRIMPGPQRDNCMKDVRDGERETNFADFGIQVTRNFRALKLWMSLKVFGLAAFRDAVARGFELAEYTERVLRCSPRWEVVTPAQLGVVTFRYRPEQDMSDEELGRLNEKIAESLSRDGFARISSARLRGRVVLRMRTTNPRTTEADIRETLQRLEMFARAPETERGVCVLRAVHGTRVLTSFTP